MVGRYESELAKILEIGSTGDEDMFLEGRIAATNKRVI